MSLERHNEIVKLLLEGRLDGDLSDEEDDLLSEEAAHHWYDMDNDERIKAYIFFADLRDELWYGRLRQDLEKTGQGKLQCFGDSMMPVLASGSVMTFQKQEAYKAGDAVFCQIGQSYIDCHWIARVDPDLGYLICDNHGNINGWTKTVFGRAIRAEINGTTKELK